MSVMLATLCLNEMEWLPKLYEQHKDWPNVHSWVFVEAADWVYAETNSELVTKNGLSTDGTTEFLSQLAKEDKRVTHLKVGRVYTPERAMGKVAARQAYLDFANVVQPQFLFVIDADEFYTREDQGRITTQMKSTDEQWAGFLYRFRNIWHPPSLVGHPLHGLFSQEVVGAYWDIPHCKGWRWRPDMRYSGNHQVPVGGRRMKRFDIELNSPQCIHMAFASKLEGRKAKHEYYKARGEGKSDGRQMYVDCRAAFETWKQGEPLPHGAQVIPYNGPKPEVFQETLP